MGTITMWAELSSSNVSDARTTVRPLNSTSQPANAIGMTNARTVIISCDDAAKIRKDAEMAIVQDEKNRESRVYHGDSVIFNESDVRITEHVRFFRSSKGASCGFMMNGKIYIDSRIVAAEASIHE